MIDMNVYTHTNIYMCVYIYIYIYIPNALCRWNSGSNTNSDTSARDCVQTIQTIGPNL